MGSVVLYVGASAIVLGLGGALALALLGRAPVTGVARSLALIEQGVRPSEVGKNELPAADRLVKPFFVESNLRQSIPALLSCPG